MLDQASGLRKLMKSRLDLSTDEPVVAILGSTQINETCILELIRESFKFSIIRLNWENFQLIPVVECHCLLLIGMSESLDFSVDKLVSLRRSIGLKKIGVVVNGVTGADQARRVYCSLRDFSERRVKDLAMDYLGFIPLDLKRGKASPYFDLIQERLIAEQEHGK